VAERSSLGPWVRRFLLEHLVDERNLSKNTQQSYRDALRLLLPFAANRVKKAVDCLQVDHLNADTIRAFLAHLEKNRRCVVRTRNQRLAAIHALVRFIGERSPEHLQWCSQIRTVPFKRTGKPPIPYLEKFELDALLAAPNVRTEQGRRDHALLLFLYNSGARASEATQVTVGDIEALIDGSGVVELLGKGNKRRTCPLWKSTMSELLPLTRSRTPTDRLFLNRFGHPITRFGVHTMVERHAKAASKKVPSIRKKRVSPHTIRHSTATHLLRSGVDINTIRAWMGHVSIDTTNIYADIDLEMKTRALAACETDQRRRRQSKRWKDDRSLLTFLNSL
jgi:integrase/recombinase XerD